MKTVVRLFLILLILLLAIVLLGSFFVSYQSLIINIQQTTDNLGIRLDVPNLLSPLNFILLRIGLFTLNLALLYIAIFNFGWFYNYVKLFFHYIFQAFGNVWKDIKSKEAVAVLAIPFIASVYFGLTIPVSYDEVWTYLEFTSKPFYHCMVYYPYPNNHVLHSLITNLTDCLPFFDILFKIRIPVILVSLLTWCIAYSFLKKYYSAKVALFVVAIFSVAFRSVYYSFLSRGYGYILLFFVIALYAAYNIVYKGNRKKDWMFFIISGILGCYALPSFLYPFATINLFVFIYNYKKVVVQIKANVITGFFVLLLYTPIFMTSGFKAISNNQFVSPEHRTRFDVLFESPSFFFEMLENFFKIPSVIVFIVILVAFLWVVYLRKKDRIVLWLVFLITPFILLFLHSVIPFHRTFIYYCFVIVFLVGISFQEVLNKLSKTYLLISLLFIQVISVIHFKLNIAEDEAFNTYANDVTDKILEKDKTYIINYPHIIFTAIQKGYNIDNIKVEEGPDISWANADTIYNYDYVAIFKLNDRTEKRKPFYSNKMMNVYKK